MTDHPAVLCFLSIIKQSINHPTTIHQLSAQAWQHWQWSRIFFSWNTWLLAGLGLQRLDWGWSWSSKLEALLSSIEHDDMTWLLLSLNFYFNFDLQPVATRDQPTTRQASQIGTPCQHSSQRPDEAEGGPPQSEKLSVKQPVPSVTHRIKNSRLCNYTRN